METEKTSEIKREIIRIKKNLSDRKRSIKKVETLIQRNIDKDVQTDLWELSDYELEEEMKHRLISLDKDSNCLPRGRITSHRKRVGWIIVFFKKILRMVSIPYSRLILTRQNRFNQDLVAFHLATFIKLQKIRDRLRLIENQTNEFIEGQKDLLKELKSLKSKIDNYKKD